MAACDMGILFHVDRAVTVNAAMLRPDGSEYRERCDLTSEWVVCEVLQPTAALGVQELVPY